MKAKKACRNIWRKLHWEHTLLVPDHHRGWADHKATSPSSLLTCDCQWIVPHFLFSSTRRVHLSFCLLFPAWLTALVSEIIDSEDHFSALLHQSHRGLPCFHGSSQCPPTFRCTRHWHSTCQMNWPVAVRWGRGIDLYCHFLFLRTCLCGSSSDCGHTCAFCRLCSCLTDNWASYQLSR